MKEESTQKVEKAMDGLRPMHDHVFLQRDEVRHKGKVILTDATKQSLLPRTGTVLAVGPGATRIFSMDGDARLPMTVQIGDRVIFGNVSTFRVDPADEATEISICREGDIIAILPPEEVVPCSDS